MFHVSNQNWIVSDNVIYSTILEEKNIRFVIEAHHLCLILLMSLELSSSDKANLFAVNFDSNSTLDERGHYSSSNLSASMSFVILLSRRVKFLDSSKALTQRRPLIKIKSPLLFLRTLALNYLTSYQSCLSAVCKRNLFKICRPCQLFGECWCVHPFYNTDP